MSNAIRSYLLLAGLAALAGCGTNSTVTDNGSNPTDGTNPGNDNTQISGNTVTVNGANALVVQSCGVVPAGAELPAGSYTITLDSSTLSKGNVSTGDDQALKSTDNYVLVYLPLAAGAKGEDHRFFMLNGVRSSFQFTLPSPGRLQAMFIDSDQASNSGQAAVSVQPGNYQLKIDAVANVLRWQDGCKAAPAKMDLKAGSYTVQLARSTLAVGGASKDDFVVVRSPSEDANDDHRYVVLNGVNAKASLSFKNSGTLRAWAVGLQNRPSGEAILSVQ